MKLYAHIMVTRLQTMPVYILTYSEHAKLPKNVVHSGMTFFSLAQCWYDVITRHFSAELVANTSDPDTIAFVEAVMRGFGNQSLLTRAYKLARDMEFVGFHVSPSDFDEMFREAQQNPGYIQSTGDTPEGKIIYFSVKIGCQEFSIHLDEDEPDEQR